MNKPTPQQPRKIIDPTMLYEIAPVRQELEPEGGLVIWSRLPKNGKNCVHTGLSRSKLNELVLPCKANGFKPPVKSISLRKPGAIRGCRLIHLPSLLAYLESLADAQNPPAPIQEQVDNETNPAPSETGHKISNHP